MRHLPLKSDFFLFGLFVYLLIFFYFLQRWNLKVQINGKVTDIKHQKQNWEDEPRNPVRQLFEAGVLCFNLRGEVEFHIKFIIVISGVPGISSLFSFGPFFVVFHHITNERSFQKGQADKHQTT